MTNDLRYNSGGIREYQEAGRAEFWSSTRRGTLKLETRETSLTDRDRIGRVDETGIQGSREEMRGRWCSWFVPGKGTHAVARASPPPNWAGLVASAVHYESTVIKDDRIKIAPAVPQKHNQGQSSGNGGFFKRPQDKRCQTDNYQVSQRDSWEDGSPGVMPQCQELEIQDTDLMTKNTKRLRVAAREVRAEADGFNFYPKCIDWDNYVMNTHMPGLTGFAF
ncbi:hypothetical protein Sjap_011549 [Stephania japonica]|uniref:Uncharacterized protein n=1 Tax=Stephania japonica TaxID=461633 RepID=A0AAP0P4T5_9MAGN